MEKVLVTGASGHLGSNLVRKLVERGKDVRIFDLPKSHHPFLQGLKIEKVYGDITKEGDVRRAIKGCTHVYHLAGIVSYYRGAHDAIMAVNVGGTKLILDIAKELGVQKVVVTASTAGIGIPEKNESPLNETHQFRDRWKRVPYMYSKYLTINACKKAVNDGLDVVMVSPTTIYGPGDVGMHIGGIVKKVKAGLLFSPPGGNAVVDVRDCAHGHMLAMQKGRSGENYILANEFVTYKEMLNTMAKNVDGKPIHFVLPFWWQYISVPAIRIQEIILSAFGIKPWKATDSWRMRFQFRYFDSTKARRELGWKPEVSFEESIKDSIAFYKNEGLIE